MTDVGETLFGIDRGDPYPTYHEVRGDGLRESAFGLWFATDHATCTAVLRDPRFSSNAAHLPDFTPPPPNYYADGKEIPTDSLLSMDPPEHTRVRRLVSRTFTPRAIAEIREFTQATTDSLIDAMRGGGVFDLIDCFAFPIPLAVICRILGVPAADRQQFRLWGEDLVPLLDPIQTEEQVATARIADAELTAYLDALIEDKRHARADDLLSELIAAEESGDKLSHDELLSAASLILGAGFETTVNLIGNGLLALLRHPDELARLRSEPAVLPNAVDELLRYDSPVQMTSRIAAESLTLNGQELPVGADVVTLLGSANRDPAVFPAPDRLDLTRPNAAEHIAFSSGTHYCLGAALARMEGQVALGALVTQLPDLQLAGEPVWRDTMVLHGLRSLQLAV
ncbi:MAG TPA: cytochrome P450 [Acidimicrobiales bacterium]|nr:cytochrome P450 [Acidimicrobiales bacterium]